MDDNIFGYDPGYDYNMDGHLDEFESLMQFSGEDDNSATAEEKMNLDSSYEYDEMKMFSIQISAIVQATKFPLIQNMLKNSKQTLKRKKEEKKSRHRK